MKKQFYKLWSLLFLLICMPVAALGGVVNIPTAVGSYISTDEATLANCNSENSGKDIGSTHNGSTMTMSLNNTAAGDYILQFLSGANNLTATIDVNVKGGGFDETQNFNITNTGSWTPSELHTMELKNLPAGNLTLKLTVTSTTGSYAGNYGSFAIRSAEDYFDLSRGTYSGAKTIDNQTSQGGKKVGYCRNNTSATYYFYALEDGNYNLCMAMNHSSDGTMNVSITDCATETEEVNQDIAINSDLCKGYGVEVPMALTNALTSGLKKIKLTFNTSGNYLMDYENVRVTKINQTITMINAVLNGGTNTPTVTGEYAGSAVAKTQGSPDATYGGYKLDAGCYVGLTLADGYTFKAGDVLHVNITKANSGGSYLALYKSATDSDDEKICVTGVYKQTGDVTFTLTDAFNGLSTFYLYRSTNHAWNGYVASVSVTGVERERATQNYSITYHNNGHGTAPDNVAEAITLPNPLPTMNENGWTFGGWYTDNTLNTPAVAGATLSANTDLYAKWTEPEPELDPESTELVYDAAYSGSTVGVAESLTKQGSFNGHNSFKFSYNGVATFSAPGKVITGIKITSYNYPADNEATYTVASTKAGSTAEVITPDDHSVTSNDSNNPEEILFIINDAEANESFKLQMAGWFDAFSYFTIYYKDGPAVEAEILSMSIDGLSLNATQIADLNTNKAIALSATTNASDVVVALSDGSTATINGKGTNQITINDKWTVNLTKHVYNAVAGDKNTTIIPAQPYYSTPSTDGTFSVNIGGDSRFKVSAGTYTITAPTNVVIKQVTFNNIYENYDGDANSTINVTATSGTVNAPFFNVLDRTGRVLKFTVDGAEAGASVSFTIGGSKQKAFGNLIIDYAEVAATTPPVVLSTNVTDSEHKNHATVTITFDHAVAAATATVGGNNCRIQGLETPTLKIGAWNLPWETTSTLVLPAGTVSDAYGNVTTGDIRVDITVGSKEDYVISEFDYTVTNITELKAALDATKNNGNDRKTIFLKNGTYNANELATGPSASEIQACQLSVGKNISLIGESVEGVTIIYTPSAEGMGERTITLNDGDYAQDITFRTGIEVGGGRGVALYTQGKHIILNNCRALGGQDTYLTGGSCYWKGGEISGSTDFIFGGGDCLFDGTTISTYGGPITAGNHSANTEWGYVFKGCTIQAARSGVNDGGYDLGRTWQGEPRVAFIDTDMKIIPTAAAWGPMGDASNTWLYEYNSTKNGAAVNLSNRFCSDSNNQTTKGTDYVLSAARAAEFTMENIFGEVDGWYPAEEIPVIELPISSMKNGESLTLADNKAYNYDENFNGNVTILRTFAADGWYSLCLPFDLDEEKTAAVFSKVAEFDNQDDDNYNFTTVDAIEAGKPYIVQVDATKANPVFEGVTISRGREATGDIFVGILNPTYVIGGCVIGSGTSVNPVNAGTIKGFRAYFPTSGGSAAKRFTVDNGEATSINLIDVNENNAVRYNLNGQRVNANVKGLVIMNGKKMLNK